MSAASFESLSDADIVEVELIALDGESHRMRLLVDSGFTGTSSLVLPEELSRFIRADLPETETSGALRGLQRRGWVTARVLGLETQRTVIAIFTDVSVLSLPDRTAGMVGLSFLRQFSRWGAERNDAGWRFELRD